LASEQSASSKRTAGTEIALGLWTHMTDEHAVSDIASIVTKKFAATLTELNATIAQLQNTFAPISRLAEAAMMLARASTSISSTARRLDEPRLPTLVCVLNVFNGYRWIWTRINPLVQSQAPPPLHRRGRGLRPVKVPGPVLTTIIDLERPPIPISRPSSAVNSLGVPESHQRRETNGVAVPSQPSITGSTTNARAEGARARAGAGSRSGRVHNTPVRFLPDP
jgi:hypothetical protein